MRWPILHPFLALTLALNFSYFPSVLARDETLFASSITYCAPPDVLVVQEFDITYFKNNQSIAFSLSATNLASDLNATANVILNAYGMTPFNYTFDLCDVLQGELCPLPRYNVTGSAILPIPTAVQLDGVIPDIAFKIPDLEAVAQVTLSRVETGDVAVCLQSTLSNGWSLHTPAVSTATAVFAILSFLSSFFNSFRYPASSPTTFRTVTTFSYFQYIAMTGMLHLNYPSTYIAFATNFAWSFGFFSGSAFIQKAIERMRTKTGSNLASTSQSPTSYSDRTLSPYNFLAKDIDDPKTIDIGSFVGGTTTQTVSPGRSSIEPATITSSSETLEPGLVVYVNQMNVATGNAFMTTFFTMLFFLIAFALFVCLVVLTLRSFKKHMQSIWATDALGELRPVLLSSGLRLVQIFMLPALILIFFQWSLHDNWLSTLISVITFLALLISFSYPTYLIFRIALQHGTTELEEPIHQRSFGALIGPFRIRRYYFFGSVPLLSLIRACFVSLVKNNGFVQVVGLLVMEVLNFVALLALRPGHTRRSDVLEIFLSLLRIVSTAALLPFAREKLSVSAIPRVGVGIGIAVVLCVGVVIIAVNVLLDLLPVRVAWSRFKIWKRPRAETSYKPKELEKGDIPKVDLADSTLTVTPSFPSRNTSQVLVEGNSSKSLLDTPP